jgi:hypothetical protein
LSIWFGRNNKDGGAVDQALEEVYTEEAHVEEDKMEKVQTDNAMLLWMKMAWRGWIVRASMNPKMAGTKRICLRRRLEIIPKMIQAMPQQRVLRLLKLSRNILQTRMQKMLSREMLYVQYCF